MQIQAGATKGNDLERIEGTIALTTKVKGNHIASYDYRQPVTIIIADGRATISNDVNFGSVYNFEIHGFAIYIDDKRVLTQEVDAVKGPFGNLIFCKDSFELIVNVDAETWVDKTFFCRITESSKNWHLTNC